MGGQDGPLPSLPLNTRSPSAPSPERTWDTLAPAVPHGQEPVTPSRRRQRLPPCGSTPKHSLTLRPAEHHLPAPQGLQLANAQRCAPAPRSPCAPAARHRTGCTARHCVPPSPWAPKPDAPWAPPPSPTAGHAGAPHGPADKGQRSLKHAPARRPRAPAYRASCLPCQSVNLYTILGFDLTG